MISKIVRLLIIVICLGAIGFIAFLSFQKEHQLKGIETNIDFSAFQNIEEIVSAGNDLLTSGLEILYSENSNRKDGIKKLLQARAYFEKALKENDFHPKANGHLGIVQGILADYEPDMMLKLNMMNKAFSLLDKALQLDDKLIYPRLYRGIFSIETPDSLFNRFKPGVQDLEMVNNSEVSTTTLKKEDMVMVWFYLGKGKILLNDSEGRKYLERVINDGTVSSLVEMSRKLLDAAN
jgi:hypothetical protein